MRSRAWHVSVAQTDEPHLGLGRLVRLDRKVDLGHRLLDHRDRVRPLRIRIHTALRHGRRNFSPQGLELVGALLLADLQLALAQDLEHAFLHVVRPEALGQVVVLGDLALGDVHVDLLDLEHLLVSIEWTMPSTCLRQIRLGPRPPFSDFVRVARDLRTR